MPKATKAPAKKKSAAVEILPADAPEVEAKAVKPLARETHRIVKTFTKEVPIEDEPEDEDDDELNFDENDEVENDYEPEPAAPAVEPDPIEALLSEMGATSHNYAMRVSRLKNYERDQRTDIKSRTYCGTLSIPDPEYLREERFMQDIQIKWARPNQANFFQLQITCNGRNLKFWPHIVAVEPLTPREMQEKAPDIANNPMFAPAPFPVQETGSELGAFLKTARQLQQLGVTFGQQPQAAPAPSPEMTADLALLTLIKTDEKSREKVFGGFRSLLDGNNEKSWLDIVALALENGPAIIAQIGQLLQTPAQPPIVPPVLAAGPAPIPMSGPPVQNQTAPPSPEQQLFGFVLQSLERRAPVDQVANVITTAANTNPNIDQYVEMFLSVSAQDVLDWLVSQNPRAEAIANAPHAVNWIEELQTELRGPEQHETPAQETIM